MDALSELLIKTYPHSISLEDVTTVTLRPLLKDDEAALLRYFGSLPPGGPSLPQGGRDGP
jgi:hypothetical protein